MFACLALSASSIICQVFDKTPILVCHQRNMILFHHRILRFFFTMISYLTVLWETAPLIHNLVAVHAWIQYMSAKFITSNLFLTIIISTYIDLLCFKSLLQVILLTLKTINESMELLSFFSQFTRVKIINVKRFYSLFKYYSFLRLQLFSWFSSFASITFFFNLSPEQK